MPEVKLAKITWLDKFLDILERACNKRPVPAIMFIYLFFIVALPLSYAAAVALSALADRLVNVIDRALRPLVAKLFDRLYALIAPDAAEEGK